MDRNRQDKGHFSRRALLRTGAVTGAAAAAATAGGLAAGGTAQATTLSGAGGRSTSPARDLILYNGQIHAQNGRGAVASVIAIRGGVVAYLGDNLRTARQNFTDDTRAIDLAGKAAVPGLIDCHNHFVLMGNRPGHHTPLENAYSVADVQALYRERARTFPASPNPPASADNFITTIGGFTPSQFTEGRLPTLAELGAAVPRQPVFIMAGFTGPATTNTLQVCSCGACQPGYCQGSCV